LCETLFFFIFVYGPGQAGLQLPRAITGWAEISQVVNGPGRDDVGPGRAMKFRPVQSSSVIVTALQTVY